MGSPAVSPDGATVAFVVTTLDLERNDYRSAIRMVPAEGSGRPTRFTAGEHRDENPCWAPDGHRLAFTSKREAGNDKHSTLHIAPVTAGGEVVTLATRNEGIGALSWSPDGNHLAFTSRVRDERYESDDPKRQPPRRIERLRSKLNEEGFISDRPRHIFVVAVDGLASPVQLTDGPFEHDSPSWSPDSTQIVFSAPVTTTSTSSRPTISSSSTVVEVSSAVSPTRRSAYPSPPGRRTEHRSPRWSVPPARTRGIINSRSSTWGAVSGACSRRSSSARARHTPASVLRYGTATRSCSPLRTAATCTSTVWVPTSRAAGTSGRRRTPSHRLRLPRRHARFTATTPTTLAELFVANGEERRFTRLTDAFHEKVPSLPTERFVAPTGDGEEVDAWIVRPADFDPSARYPLLLTIHGGPWTQFGNKWFDEVQMYASAGYVVRLREPARFVGSPRLVGPGDQRTDHRR